MLAPIVIEPIALSARTVRRIENAKGLRISAVRGPVWVTQEDDPRDIILAAGDSVVLDRRGVAVVYAFRDAVITVAEAWQAPAAELAPQAAVSEAMCA